MVDTLIGDVADSIRLRVGSPFSDGISVYF